MNDSDRIEVSRMRRVRALKADEERVVRKFPSVRPGIAFMLAMGDYLASGVRLASQGWLPTNHMPGTAGKLAVLIQRSDMGWPLFHPFDAGMQDEGAGPVVLPVR